MNFFPAKKTVDSVLAGFSKMVADLEQVQREQDDLAAQQRAAMAEAAARAAEAEIEADRAAATAAKIRDLIGG